YIIKFIFFIFVFNFFGFKKKNRAIATYLISFTGKMQVRFIRVIALISSIIGEYWTNAHRKFLLLMELDKSLSHDWFILPRED
ncbi:MAG: hypothetical protein LUC45_03390, partial [Paraprevotella sp.]|nr:hypothetical protein [Paraprevotella sp.]